MSNLSEELASRGSKLCMQVCVNNIEDVFGRDKKTISRRSRKNLLDDLIGEGEIKWLSPLSNENYREYQLNEISNKYPEEMGLESFDWGFWPFPRQPQWDAIGINSESTLFLVEAKAHTSEIEGPGTQAGEKSKGKIKEEIEAVMGNDPIWMNKYYQTANRILFLDKLIKHYGDKRRVVLVFLNFTNDVTYTPEDLETWEKYLNTMKSEHVFPKVYESNIKYVYMDIWNDKGV
ncbi:MAG: hypothetical protein BKP49_09650 [Treponema sp. CETP13]|nr:MAG: hypothetical protein BKP49_09650 [Treponema sp. CETP13]